MYEILRTKMTAQLVSVYSPEVVKGVLSMLDRAMLDYELVKKETSIVPYESQLTETIKLYLLCRKAEGLADGSIQNFAYTLKRFAEWINKPLKEITSNDVRGYLINCQVKHNNTRATVEKQRERLNKFFKWCIMEELITKNPIDRIPPTKVPRNNRHALTSEQLEHCRLSCQTLRDTALLEVLYSTGARVSEIARLEKKDVNWTENSIRVFGKNAEYYTVFLNTKARVALKNYLNKRRDYNPHLFVTERGGRAVSSSAIRRAIEHIGQRANLEVVLSPHILRHTMATMALRNGARLEVVQKMLNHKYPNTTQIYAEMCLDDVAIAHRKTVI